MSIVYLIMERKTRRIVYVGQTSMTLSKRWNCHLKDRKPYADRVIQAHGGRKSYRCRAVFQSEDQRKVDLVERKLIRFFNTLKPNGLNLESGGRTQFITTEIKKKMSQSSPKRRRVYACVLTTNKVEVYDCVRDAARYLKACPSAISKAARGIRKTLVGRTWSYNV